MLDIIGLTIQNGCLIIMIKILIRKFYVSTNDCLLVLFTGLSTGLLFPHIGAFVSPIMVCFLCYYVNKIYQYKLNKSIFLSTLTMLVAILFDHAASIILSIIFGATSFVNESLLAIHVFISLSLPILFTIFFTKITMNIRVKINQNEKIQTLLAITSTFILFTFYGSIILATNLGSDIELIVLNFIFFIAYVIIGIIVFYFYSKTVRERYEIKRNKDEQVNLQRYTKEIEFQYNEMRKFKHDYQNILSSLESFIIEEDFEGLKYYYLENIKTTSEMMNKHLFQLESLSKIEVREIKSILAMKLMRAQEQGIDVVFEAVDIIDDIPIDSVVLVRTLGILLDNAIEELVELSDGKLLVGVVKSARSITFIVQNTCRDNIPKVHQLKQPGFSTKGAGRGVGLNNISEFVRAHSNISLETTINGNQFIQKVIIGGM